MDIDWLEILRDAWLIYSVAKEIYQQWQKRKEKGKRKLR